MAQQRNRGVSATEEGRKKLEEAKAAWQDEDEQRLTMQKLAEKSGCSVDIVKNFLGGIENVDRDGALKICRFLDLAITEVVDPDVWNRTAAQQKIKASQSVVDWERTNASLEATPDPNTTEIAQNLPGSGATQFFGRDDELTEIHTLLHQGKKVAISGYGGLGKTELALQYAKHYQTDYPGGLCWLNGAEDATADIGEQILYFAQIRLQLTIPNAYKSNFNAQIQYIWRQCPGSGDVLLVIDDVGDYGALKDYLPDQPRFKWLMTTRKFFGQPVHRFKLDTLSPAAALDLLTALVENPQRIEDQQQQAQELCHWLEYLPLGLELVGRYLYRDTGLTVIDLLGLLQQKGLEAPSLSHVPSEMTAKRGVKAAFDLSWQQLSPTAQYLAYLLSLGAAEPMSWSLVQDTDQLYHQVSQQVPVNLIDARGELLSLHLVKMVGDNLWRMHRLIWQFFRGERQAQKSIDPIMECRDCKLVCVKGQNTI
jgi:NB-ARC domain